MSFLNWIRYLGDERYSWVDAKQISAEELRQSRTPDEFLSFICIQFNASGGKLYHADHFPETVHLEGIGSSTEEFGEVERAVAEACWGKTTGDLKEQDGRLCSTIDILAKQTQDLVATMFERRYQPRFPNARIDLAHFHDVPASVYLDPGFSNRKLTYGKINHKGRVDELHISRPLEFTSASRRLRA